MDWSGPQRNGPAPDWGRPQRNGRAHEGGRGGGWGDPQRSGPAPDWSGPQQRGVGRGPARPVPRRPVPGWRDRNQQALQEQRARQRDPDWDDPQQLGPDWEGPGWDGPGHGGPDWRGPGRGGPGGRSPGRRRRSGRKRRPLHQRRWAQVTAAVLAAFLITVSWSVGHALTAPGGGTLSTRLAEWARDHYLGPLVTFGEWLTYQPPKVGGKPSFSLSGEGIAAAKERERKLRGRRAAIAALYAPPLPLKSLAGAPLPGEGQWRVLANAKGRPAIFGTYLRASSVYSSYVAGIAELNQRLVKFQLRPGSEDPGGSNWKAPSWIPPGTRTGLLGTFNSGFKIDASGGGFYLNGQTAGTITNGVASEVYYRDGHMTIGVWGQTVHMTPDVVAVRQNLHLIVDHGQIPATVDNNVVSSWGATLGGGYYVWRSGVGETRNGRIVFAYGPALNVREIAELLQRAGAVTAMQLDINPAWMSFQYYLPKGQPNDPTPFNLLPTEALPPDHYYSINGRDFTAVYSR
jgi:Phosphodiester glycosidase